MSTVLEELLSTIRKNYSNNPEKMLLELQAFNERKFNHLAVIGNVELSNEPIIAKNEDFDSLDSFIKIMYSNHNANKEKVVIYQFAKDYELPDKNFIKDTLEYKSFLCSTKESVNCYSMTKIIESSKRNFIFDFQKALTFIKKIIDENLIEDGKNIYVFLRANEKEKSRFNSYILIQHFPNSSWEINFYQNGGIMNRDIDSNDYILFE